MYLYIDPRDGSVFCVGKGRGNRAFSHLEDRNESRKVKRMNEIRRVGLEPTVENLVHQLADEETALRIEAAVIDLLGLDELTNQVRGWKSGIVGRLPATAIAALCDARPEDCVATGGHTWDRAVLAEIAPDGCPLPPIKWDEDRRAVLRAELDAYYARLYGLNREQLRYILDPHGLSQRELEDILDPWEDPTCAGPHLLPEKPALDFPGETFRVLKDGGGRMKG